MLHLGCAVLFDRFRPWQQWIVGTFVPFFPHLPNGMMAISMAEGTGKEVPIGCQWMHRIRWKPRQIQPQMGRNKVAQATPWVNQTKDPVWAEGPG